MWNIRLIGKPQNQFGARQLWQGMLLGLIVAGSPSPGTDWPRWRGADGSGTAAGTGWPIHWSTHSDNVRWKTAIPGEGISSPIIVNGRVFLTTAYEGAETTFLGHALLSVGTLLVLLLLLRWFVLPFFRRPASSNDGAPDRSAKLSPFRFVRDALAWALPVGAAVLTLMKDESPAYNWAMRSLGGNGIAPACWFLLLSALLTATLWVRCRHRWQLALSVVITGVAIWSTRWYSPDRYRLFAAAMALFVAYQIANTHSPLRDSCGPRLGLVLGLDRFLRCFASLTFLLASVLALAAPELFWTAGEPGPIWMASGLIAMIGLIAAIAWIRPVSRVRLIGSVVLLGVGILLYAFAPMDRFGNFPPLWKRAFTAGPGLLASFWFSACFFACRQAKQFSWPPKRGLLDCVGLAILALFVFVPANWLRPQVGMLRAVLCIDAKTGQILWDRPVFAAALEPKYRLNTYATPTPCADDECLAVDFGSGIACLDFEGRVKWKLVDPDYALTTVYGAASSPILFGGMVIVVRESEKSTADAGKAKKLRRPSYIAAYDKNTGTEQWRVDSEDMHDSYSTPLLIAQEDCTDLILASWNAVVALDAATGVRRWSYPVPLEQVVPSIVSSENCFWLSAGAHGPKGTLAFRGPGTDSTSPSAILWQDKKANAECASPVMVDGKLFVVSAIGIISCYDGMSGRVLWRERLGGTFFSSLVAADGKIYATSEDGDTTVIEASPSLKILSRNKLEESVYASAALSDGKIYIRTAKHLFCISGQSRESPVKQGARGK